MGFQGNSSPCAPSLLAGLRNLDFIHFGIGHHKRVLSRGLIPSALRADRIQLAACVEDGLHRARVKPRRRLETLVAAPWEVGKNDWILDLSGRSSW